MTNVDRNYYALIVIVTLYSLFQTFSKRPVCSMTLIL